jgi:hypothetical protein
MCDPVCEAIGCPIVNWQERACNPELCQERQAVISENSNDNAQDETDLSESKN